jgi:hypothetical protein
MVRVRPLGVHLSHQVNGDHAGQADNRGAVHRFPREDAKEPFNRIHESLLNF